MATVSKREWTYKGETKTGWVVRYTDPGGKRHQLAAPTKREADRLRLKIETEIDVASCEASWEVANIEKFASAYIKDLDSRERDQRIGWSHAYKQKGIIRRYLIPILGKTRVDRLGVQQVIDLYETIRKSGVSAHTAKGYIRYFGYMEKFANKRGYTRKTPFAQALKELSGIKSNKIKTFMLEDVKAIIRCLEKPRHRQHARTHEMMRCAVNLAAFCGLRWGEVYGLTRDAVDFDKRVLRIRRGMTARGLSGTTKTMAGQRDIPMPRHIADLLRAWLARYYVENPDELIFTVVKSAGVALSLPGKVYERGRGMTHGAFYPSWRALLADAGLTGRDEETAYHFHALRHFASALMVENHIPLTDVAALMGHKHFDMTLQVYAHSIVGGHTRHAAFESMSTMLEATRELSPPEKASNSIDLL